MNEEKKRKIFDLLTEEHKQELKKSFDPMKEDPQYNGVSIFIRLFSENPELKNIFPQFRTCYDSELFSSPLLRAHGVVYMNEMMTIIDSLDDSDAMCNSLISVANTHRIKGVKNEHLMEMVDPILAVVKACNGGEISSDTKEAWRTLFQVIATLIDQLK